MVAFVKQTVMVAGTWSLLKNSEFRRFIRIQDLHGVNVILDHIDYLENGVTTIKNRYAGLKLKLNTTYNAVSTNYDFAKTSLKSSFVRLIDAKNEVSKQYHQGINVATETKDLIVRKFKEAREDIERWHSKATHGYRILQRLIRDRKSKSTVEGSTPKQSNEGEHGRGELDR